MAFTIGSGTFTNGSATVTGVTLTSGTLAYFASGTRMVVGVNPVVQEVEAIAAPTVTTITLRSAWTGTGGTYSFLANQTSEGLRDAVQAIRTNNASLQSFIDSIDVENTNNSVVQRTTNGRVKTSNATESNDAIALGQASTTATNNSVAQRDASGQLIATNVIIADKIIHDGDTNTAIRFPAADTVTVETNGAERMRIDSTGRFLINETSPVYLSKFTLSFDPVLDNGPITLDSRSFAINRGGSMSFGGKFNSAGDYRPYALIAGRKENATDGNSAGYLSLQTNGNSADPTERLRIDSSGNVGIGTSSPATKLDVSGAIRASTGILFGSDTAAANTLDDYEEGTWAPVFNEQPAGTGVYTKIGRLVTLQGVVECDANGSASGPLGIAGLPFSVSGLSLSLSMYIFNMNSSATGNNIASPTTGDSFFIRRDAFVRQNSTGSNPFFNFNLFKIGTVIHVEGSYLTE